MSLEPLLPVTLIGPAARREAWLKALQAAGLMHIDAARRPKTGALARQARAALKDLAQARRQRPQIRQEAQFDWAPFVAEVLRGAERRVELGDARDQLARRLEELLPFGELGAALQLEAETGLRPWLYAAPRRNLPDGALPGWTLASASPTEAFLVAFARSAPPAPAPGGRFVEAPGEPLAAIQARLAQLELALDEAEVEREAHTRRYRLLAQSLAAAEDAAALAAVEAALRLEDGLAAVSGWVPTARREELAALAQREGLALAFAGPEAEPPVLLKPGKFAAPGADLAAFYQLPSPRDWDVSATLFVSFLAFFGMILSDAGYALVLLLLGAAWRAPRRLRGVKRLWLGGAAAALVCGVLVGSYFGEPPPTPWLARLQLLRLENQEAMLALCAVIGALHVGFANLMAAWAARGRLEAVSRLGWIVVLCGGGVLAATWQGERMLAYGVLGFGLGLVALGSGGLAAALANLASLTKLLSDVLSYLRLFALALAGGALAAAFNDLAQEARGAAPGVGVLLGGAILLLGHALNLTLCVAGGVVHGLRLNFIEFYNWTLTGEGRPFTPFARRA